MMILYANTNFIQFSESKITDSSMGKIFDLIGVLDGRFQMSESIFSNMSG